MSIDLRLNARFKVDLRAVRVLSAPPSPHVCLCGAICESKSTPARLSADLDSFFVPLIALFDVLYSAFTLISLILRFEQAAIPASIQ